jgi:hypothetical protein
MKNKLTTLILAIFILASCSQESQKKTESVSSNVKVDTLSQKKSYDTIFVDKTYVGMTLTKLKSIYKDLEFTEESMFFYGVDSEENGLLLKKNNEPFIFVWTKEDSDSINGITILTDQITIDNNVHVGITISDFFSKYKNAKLQIDQISNETEFGFVMNKLNYRIEFITADSNRVGEYDMTQAEPEFIKLKRPEAKVERISVFN